MIGAALVTFTSLWLLSSHLSEQTKRRLVGYKGWMDLILHGLVIVLFYGTMHGLLQAEAAAIGISLYLRFYHRYYGYERVVDGRWVRYAGVWT